MLEGVLAVIAATAPVPAILCGDFNVPQVETADGLIVFGARGSPRQGCEDAAPTTRTTRRPMGPCGAGAMQGHPESILGVDAYAIDGYGREDFSWVLKRKTLSRAEGSTTHFAPVRSKSIVVNTSTIFANNASAITLHSLWSFR